MQHAANEAKAISTPRALAAHHLVLIRGQDSCYVVYREFRYKDVPVFAIVLHVSNPDCSLCRAPPDPSSVGSSSASGDPG